MDGFEVVRAVIEKAMVKEQIVSSDQDGTLFWSGPDQDYLVEVKVFPIGRASRLLG